MEAWRLAFVLGGAGPASEWPAETQQITELYCCDLAHVQALPASASYISFK